jgi:outer membrane protein assembly factor BamB
MSCAPATPRLLWSVQLPGAGDFWSSPVIAGGRLYIGGASGSIYCLNAGTGATVWTFSTGDEQPVFSSPSVIDGVVYVAGYRSLYAIPCEDPNGDGVITAGEVVWRRQFGPSTGGVNDVNCASPAVAGGGVYLGSVDQYFYGFDAEAGGPLWKTFTPYRGQHAFSSSPAVLGDLVFDATGNQSGSGRLYCFNGRSGRILWEFDIDDVTFSTPAVSGGRVYIANSGDWVGGNAVHLLYCLDTDGIFDGVDDGEPDGHAGGSDLIWSFDMGDYAYSSPALHDGRLYIGCADGRLLCLDSDSGRLLWVHRTHRVALEPPRGIMGSPAVAGGMVFVGTEDGRLIAVPERDPNGDGVITDPELIWSYSIGGMVVSSPAVAYGRVYVAGTGGRIYCFGE